MNHKKNIKFETAVTQGLHFIDPVNGGIVPPLQPSTNFARDKEYQLIAPQHSYGRDSNPTYDTAEQMLALMERGEDAMLFSSGMSAAMAVMQALQPGDHIVAPTVMYWGLRNWLTHFCEKWGLELDFFEPSSHDDLAAKIRNGSTRIVWIETPCNPTWDVTDITKATEIAHDAGARVVADSTVATPVLSRPIEFGADLVMHSASKYLNGHADVIAGALIAARQDEFWDRIRAVRAEGGAILGTFEAWLLQRGMRTVYLRVRRASESALQIARHFEAHQALEAVLYPGLENHPGHAIAARQMEGGFGGMLSLRIRGGASAALKVAGKCEVFVRATSLGSVESLIEHRYSIEGASSPIPKDLLRLSVGIEAVTDLIEDLEQALA